MGGQKGLDFNIRNPSLNEEMTDWAGLAKGENLLETNKLEHPEENC